MATKRARTGLLAMAALAFCGTAGAADWLPIDAAELAMTAEPKDPSASAIYLYRQEDINDAVGTIEDYVRVKILSEAGRNNANVEIDYDKTRESFRYIEARTIHADGSVVNFDGTVYDTPVKVGRGADLYARTFTLQGVEVGSIIEYRYLRETRKHNLRYRVHWFLNQSLFTKEERFSLLPASIGILKVTLPAGLPDGTRAPQYEGPRLVLEARDVPAFVLEEQMPPENAVRSRVDFTYVDRKLGALTPAEFWTAFGRDEHQHIEAFVNRPRAMQKALREIISPGDSPAQRLQKIYARAQRFNDAFHEREKIAEETLSEPVAPPRDVEDLWRAGHGNARQVPWLFLALARAAGFHADPVLAAGRGTFSFDKKDMNAEELDSRLVIVELEGRELILDPGNPYAPFGELPWYESAVTALRLNASGGVWIETPAPTPDGARIERTATLALDMQGTLSGHLLVSYVGSEATWRRLAEREEDAPARRKFLEDEIRASIPAISEVTLVNEPAWESAGETLEADFDLRVDAWADVAGARMLLPVEVFGGEERRLFEHAKRLQPVYFDFPFKRRDEVSVALPAGFRATFVPQARHVATDTMDYRMVVEESAGGLRLRRDLAINRTLIKVDAYDSLRGFYQSVRSGDEQRVVLGAASAGAG